MRTEQCDDLNDVLRLMVASNRPFYFRMVSKGPDGKPALVVRKREAGLDVEARRLRKEAKDKRMAAGRILQRDGTWVFGIDEGNLPPKQVERCLRRSLAKDPPLRRYKRVFAKADVLADDAWDAIKPSDRPGHGGETDGLEGDDLDLATATQTQAKGRKVSSRSQRKGSDYAQFLEALDTWHRRFGAGKSFGRSDYRHGLEHLERIEGHADDWLSKHQAKWYDSSKVRDRRAMVKQVKAQIAVARDKLEAFAAVGRGIGEWTRDVHDPVAPEELPKARSLAKYVRRAVNRVEKLAGAQSARGGAAEAFAVNAEKAVKAAERGIKVRFKKALRAWDRAFPEAPTVDQAEEARLLALPIVASIHEVEVGFPGFTPPEMAHAKEAVDQAQALDDPTQARLLKALRDDTKGVARIWPKGVVDVRDLSKARAGIDRLDASLRAARKGKVVHDDVGEAERVLKMLRASVVALTSQGVDDGLTDKERAARDAAERAEATKRAKSAKARHTRWTKKTDEAFDDGRYTYQAGNKATAGKGGFGFVTRLASKKKGDPKLVGKVFRDPEEFDKELAVYEAIGSHPNIVRCLGRRTVKGPNPGGAASQDREMLVLEEVDGGTVEDALYKGREALKAGTLTHDEYWAAVQHIMRGTLRGLAHMQSKGLGHNDIKPPNVMIDTQSGEAILIDMGGGERIGTTGGVSTEGYVPNKGRGTGPSETAGETRDVYAVGGVARTASGDTLTSRGWTWALESKAKDLFRGKAQPPKDGKRGKKDYAAPTAYDDFVKATYGKDPAARPTLAEALRHPFLADPILPEAEAKKAVRKLAKLT